QNYTHLLYEFTLSILCFTQSKTPFAFKINRQENRMGYQYEIFMFWYVGFIFWVLLLISLITFLVAIKRESWIMTLVSLILIIPNVIFMLIDKLELIIYLAIILPILQILMVVKFIKKGMGLT
ncbi:hypothetical protein, partial [Bacillus pseudomycoides]|uniref:hypothetical protein n=2 Tax=Bacillaceae TaxID=186817 RepID=UPI00211D371F